MNKLIVITFSLLLLINFSGCLNKTNDNKEDTKDKIIIGINQEVFGFYPWIESFDVVTLSVNKNIFNGLIGVDTNYKLVPELAKSWNNPDNLTWRFFLRENVTFHNGNTFTAHDVKYSIDFIKSNETNIFNEVVSPISEVIIIDDYTIDIKTKKEYPTLSNKLIDLMIISKDYHEGQTGNKWPVGTGAYKLFEQNSNHNIILTRFDGYWKGSPEIKTVEFRIIEDSLERKNALMNKTVDLADAIYPEYYNELNSIDDIVVKYINTPTIYYLSFDFRKNNGTWINGNNPFSFIEVRKAIYHSINITELIDEFLYGFGSPSSQFVFPLIFGYNPDIERLPFDLKTAKQLMKDAGFESGFEVKLDCPDDNLMKNISTKIAEQLSKINISIDLNFLSTHDWLDKIYNRNTSFYLLGWIPSGIDGGEIFEYMLRTVDDERNFGSFNAGYYSNVEVDSIAEEVSWTMNVASRQRLIQKGFAIAMQDVAWIPLFSIQWLYGMRGDIDFNPRPDLNIKLEEIRCQ